jgi:hypothetical protein
MPRATPRVGSTMSIAVDGLLNRQRRLDSRTRLDERVSGYRLADRCADSTAATADGHDEAVLRPGIDAAASDLELLEGGRQKATRAVVLSESARQW